MAATIYVSLRGIDAMVGIGCVIVSHVSGAGRACVAIAGQSELFLGDLDSCHLSEAIIIPKFNVILFDNIVVGVPLGSDRDQK